MEIKKIIVEYEDGEQFECGSSIIVVACDVAGYRDLPKEEWKPFVRRAFNLFLDNDENNIYSLFEWLADNWLEEKEKEDKEIMKDFEKLGEN